MTGVANKDIDLITSGTGKVKYNGTEVAKRAANTFTGTQTLSGTGKLLTIGDDSSIYDVNESNTARWS